MAFRNDHEAALHRAKALQTDLDAERVAEAEKDKRIAALEHDLDAAQGALARAGIAAPASATATATWAEVSAQLDHYLAERALLQKRSGMRVGGFFVGITTMMILTLVVHRIWATDAMLWLAIGPAAAIGLAMFVAAGLLFRPAKTNPPITCPTCKLGITGTASSNEIQLVRRLHRCPHCQGALARD